jgi:DNA-directed RNA polymerase I subunit RPA2
MFIQARERLTSYRGRMTIKLCWTDPSGQVHDMMKDCGLVPIMVRVCGLIVFNSSSNLERCFLSQFDVICVPCLLPTL